MISVLTMMLVLTTIATAFVSFANREQRLAGGVYRRAAALFVAEAGSEKALALLSRRPQEATDDGSLLPAGYGERLGAGAFMIEEVQEQSSGLIAIIVRGEVGGTSHRIRRLARIAPRGLSYALLAGTVALAGRARTYVVPLSADRVGARRFGDIAASREFSLERAVSLNALEGRRFALRGKVITDYELFGDASSFGAHTAAELPEVVLARGVSLVIAGEDVQTLRDPMALRLEVPAAHIRAFRLEEISTPEIDPSVYRGLARENFANARLNKEVGDRTFDRTLATKSDGLYTRGQFERVLGFLDSRQSDRRSTEDVLRLSGLVFVDGTVTVSHSLVIEDGGLVAADSIRVADGARLEVRHGPATAGLPGVVAFGSGGTIRVGSGAVLIVDGLLFASTGLEVLKGTVDIWGAAILAQGFLNEDGLVVIRYQRGVLGTAGVRRSDDAIVHAISWEELR